MYLRTLKAARSAKIFWEEIFMPKSQLGGILYIFPPGPVRIKKYIFKTVFALGTRLCCVQCTLMPTYLTPIHDYTCWTNKLLNQEAW